MNYDAPRASTTEYIGLYAILAMLLLGVVANLAPRGWLIAVIEFLAR